MRIPVTAHTGQPWRIHQIAPDFQVEDVWVFRTPGAGPDDFPVMLDALRAAGGPASQSLPARFLFGVRQALGALFGWDSPQTGTGARVRSLLERLPDDLRQEHAGERVPGIGFTMVYELPNECAMEIANKTVHAICHFGWVQDGSAGYEMRMAVLVKPNGRLGQAYMAAIAPFRHLIVYPAVTRQWEQAWQDRVRLAAIKAPR